MPAIELFSTPLFNDADLKAYWRLEGNSNDAKGSNNGTDTSITYSTSDGKFGQGIHGNGTSSKIVIPDASVLKPTTAYTIMFWAKINSSSYMNLFQSCSINPNFAGFRIHVNSGLWGIGHGKNTGLNSGTDYVEPQGSVNTNDNTFHLIAGMWTGSRVQIYIDGVLDADIAFASAAAYAATNYVRIGCDNSAGTDGSFFNSSASIDDIALFARALTATELLTHYNGAYNNSKFFPFLARS